MKYFPSFGSKFFHFALVNDRIIPAQFPLFPACLRIICAYFFNPAHRIISPPLQFTHRTIVFVRIVYYSIIYYLSKDECLLIKLRIIIRIGTHHLSNATYFPKLFSLFTVPPKKVFARVSQMYGMRECPSSTLSLLIQPNCCLL